MGNLLKEIFNRSGFSLTNIEADLKFNSADELKAYLPRHSIPVEKFGTDDAKTIEHFFAEISNGECRLVEENGELRRKVTTANIDVYYLEGDGSTLYLKETCQVFDGERRRSRDNIAWSISKKLKPGEDPREAAVRGMLEELGIEIKATDLEQTKTVQKTANSPSYPGLQSEYTSTYFSIFLLPGEYRPEGYVEEQDDVRTHFNWVKVGW